ncbi:MAG: hydrogenase maturation nickel metallochaperone HypA [Candidatus Omnitrophica bacterium]|nr:hydrogenase maturation nickel metallochaperone HypA [Candidatus Omnitrophota bacterium]
MHEVSIVEGLITQVSAQQKERKFKTVHEVHIACGMYNCLSEETLNFCMQTVAEGTCLAKAVIKVRRLAERWQCLACRKEFFQEDRKPLLDTACPHCAAKDVIPRPNNEIYLDKLEVD